MVRLNKDELTDNIHQLAYRDHARLKTEMYLGSRNVHTQSILCLPDSDSLFINLNESFNATGMQLEEISWVPALATYAREIIDNVLDEFAHGYGSRLDVTYNETSCEFTVKDDGRGIPIDKAVMALTQPMTGRNFGERKEIVGTNGYGASAVSNTSEYFNFTIHQPGKKLDCEINEGDPQIGGMMNISDPLITSYRGSHTGTTISFKPSKHVFRHLVLPDRFVKTRMFEIAVCNPNYKIYYNGELLKIKPRIESSLFPNRKTIKMEIADVEKGFKSTFFLIPNFVEAGDHYHTLVNNIFAHNGGVHVETFKRTFPSCLLRGLERESKKRKLIPNRSDISEGLLVYNITTMQQPDFDSQSKTRLINEEAGDAIRKFFEDESVITTFIKENREWIDEIFQRCSDRTQKRDATEISKLSRKILRNKVPGLMDATAVKRNDCILFLAEGDSAIGGMASVRNPDIHGGLALRGKVMNVNGENPKKVLDNKCLTEIMNSVGLVVGQEAKRHNLRYGKIYLATDMDHDGSNIAALLINFFYTYWPELFNFEQPPFIYVFQTPFVIAEKGKQKKYWYAHNYKDFEPKNYTSWSITRAKGLGTLTEADWEHSLRNPVVIPILEDGKMQESLELIFSPRKTDLRKQWIGL